MKRKPKGINNPHAWNWVRSLADSMIVMAAALTVVGFDLKDNEREKDLGRAEIKIELLQTEAIQLKDTVRILIDKQNSSDNRLIEVEKLAHSSGERNE